MIGLWSIWGLCSLVSAYFLVIAVVCIWVGLNHVPQDGFWIPILTGTLFTVLILCLFVRVTRGVLNKMKEKDTFDL
jgi:membrane protein implicated in regulation of membrane protease activity